MAMTEALQRPDREAPLLSRATGSMPPVEKCVEDGLSARVKSEITVTSFEPRFTVTISGPCWLGRKVPGMI